MQDRDTNRAVQTSGSSVSGSFGISRENETHIQRILRDMLYTDKVSAPMREYSANAWDAHRDVGKGDLPIKVHIPTDLKPVFWVRDFGPGLSDEDVIHHYTQYGDSSKRSSDATVGMLGIGCKSAFCYADTFTVTSWFNGTKSVFVAVLDETDTGTMSKFHEEPCGDETGLEVQIPVHRKDVLEFQTKAMKLFRYWMPRPDINITIPYEIHTDIAHGYVTEGSFGGNWTAVMGCIPYRIDINQVQQQLETLMLWEAAKNLSGGLFFDIGEVQISASREELKYGERTKTAIVETFSKLFHEYVAEVTRSLSDPAISEWEKRLRTRAVSNKTLRFALPAQYKSYLEREVPIDTKEGFLLTRIEWHKRISSSRITVDGQTVIYIKDDTRPLKGFSVPSGTYVVRGVGTAVPEKIRERLNERLKEAKLTGIPIKNLSELPFDPNASRGASRGQASRKYQVSCFQLNLHGCENPDSKASNNWDAVERVPEPEDVFVILSSFKPLSRDFFNLYERDQVLLKFLNKEMPPVYGYKTTDTKPITAKDCVGVEYKEWRKSLFQKVLTHEMKLAIREMQWAESVTYNPSYYQSRLTRQGFADFLTQSLGVANPLGKIYRKHAKMHARFNVKKVSAYSPLRTIEEFTGFPNTVKSKVAAVLDRYPLLREYGVAVLWGENRDLWIDYIKMSDTKLGLASTGSELSDQQDEENEDE